MSKIRMIAAIDLKRGIAKDGNQPWDLPGDLAYFRRQTMGKTVVMGANTYKIIGELDGRQNVVLSREDLYVPDHIMLVSDLATYLKDSKKDIWIIGGGQVYASALQYAEELYLTQIDADFGCDVFFPEFEHLFHRVDNNIPQTENDLTFTFQKWSKN